MYAAVKRLADVGFALLLILLLSPALPLLALALRLTAEGEVFYRQQRVGYGNRLFWIWKFATMLKNSPQMGSGSLTLRRDPRVTPLGRFLRRSKLNEAPQLLNVLLGDMSFVGPRPQMPTDFALYSPEVKAALARIKPGITGIGSVIFRDEERLLSQPGLDPRTFYAQTIAPYKGQLELWYLRRRSLRTDLLLLGLTAWALFFPESRLPYRVFPDLPAKPF